MKKENRNKLIVIGIVIALVSVWAYNEKQGKQIYDPLLPPPSPPSCNADFSTDATDYALGDTVSFTLLNTTDTNCTSEEEYCWMFYKLVGDIWEPCYSPPYDPTPFILLPTESKTWTWDQITNSGEDITEGEYMVWIYYYSLSEYVGELYIPSSPSYDYECMVFFTITTPPPATTTPAPTTPAPEGSYVPPPRIIPPDIGEPASGEGSGMEEVIATVAEVVSDNIIEVIIIGILIVILIILTIKEIALIYILLTLIPLIYMLYRIFLEKKICILNLIIMLYIIFLLYKRRKKKKGG